MKTPKLIPITNPHSCLFKINLARFLCVPTPRLEFWMNKSFAGICCTCSRITSFLLSLVFGLGGGIFSFYILVSFKLGIEIRYICHIHMSY